MKIRRYFGNLWLALTGRNPHNAESDDQQLKDYQNLTENLRKRITEKDMRIDAITRDYSNAVITMRKQHKMRVEELETENAQLQEDRDYALNCSQEARKAMAQECMANVMIERTNGWLDGLYDALVSGDTEKLAAIGGCDELGSRFSRIVQQCIAITRRKQELEARK